MAYVFHSEHGVLAGIYGLVEVSPYVFPHLLVVSDMTGCEHAAKSLSEPARTS